jgi:DnaJ-class molecular chaperone
MARCQDCDGVEIMSVPPRGDGRCAECHGTGEGGLLDSMAEMIGGEESECSVCHGTGQCQTCGGTGEVEGEEESEDDY